MFCRQCSYNLQAIPSARCPECGRAFDPADPASFLKAPRTPLRIWGRRIIFVLLVPTILIGAPLGWVYWGWRSEQRVVIQLKSAGCVINTQPLLPASVRRHLPAAVNRWLERADEVFYGAGAYDGPRLLPRPVNLAGLGTLAHVQRVFLSDAALSSSDVQEISRLPHLRQLQLLDCDLSDEQVAPLSESIWIEELWLDGNPKLTDAALGSLQHLTRLRVLRFYRSRITDAGVEHLAGMTELEDLQLGESQVTDAGMPFIGRLTKLKTLDIRANISDAGLKHVEGLTHLQWLCLDRNPITDAGLVHLRNLTELKWLSFDNTRVTNTGLLHLTGLKKLEHVGARDTGVTAQGLLELNGLPL
jgi:hypothetical protein